MQMQDSWKWGFIPAQHHGFAAENLPTDQRHVFMAVRVKKRRTGTDDLVEYEIVDESGGEEMGRHLWIPESEGAGTFPLQRWTAGWRHSWPSVAWTKDKKNRLNRVEGDPTATGSDPREFQAFPIFKGDYKHDFRYARETPAVAPDNDCFPKVAGGRIGIIMSATKEDEQIPLWMDCDSRLIAAHFAGDPLTGSLVADTNADDEIDPDRCARLQSIMRVVKEPNGCAAIFPKNPNNAKQANELAWNLARGGLGDVQGGMMTDLASTGSAGPAPSGPGTTQTAGGSGGVGPGVTQAGGGSPRVHAMASQHQSGPIVVGDKADQHNIGKDADGNPINSGHLSTNTYFFRNKVEDAPLFFEGGFNHIEHIPPAIMVNAPFSTPVFLEFDPDDDHPHICKKPKGFWKYRAGSFIYSPSDGGRVPGPMPPKPPDGPELPPIPGGLPIPPGPRTFTTAAGGVNEDFVEPEFPPGAVFEPDSGPFGGFLVDPVSGEVIFLPPLIEREGPAFTSAFSPPDWLESPSVLVKDRRQFRNLPYAASSMDLAAPAIIGRPQLIRRGVADFRNWTVPTEQATLQMDSLTPIVIRSEFWGAQKGLLAGGFTNDPYDYTERPGLGRWLGGTAPGGEAFMSPECDMADIGNAVIVPVRVPGGPGEPEFILIDGITKLGPPNLPKSDVYKVAVPDSAYWAAGLPSLEDGGIRLGYRWGTDLFGNLTFECIDKDGVITPVMTLTKECQVNLLQGVNWNIVTKTADYTVLLSDFAVLMDTSGAASNLNVFLPAAATARGQRVYVKKIAGPGSKKVIVDADGSETIDGATTHTLNTKFEGVEIICDGSEWFIISET